MNIKINMPKGEEFTNLRRPQSSTIPFLDENKKEEERLAKKSLNANDIEEIRQIQKINLITFYNCLKFLSPILRKAKDEDRSKLSETIQKYITESNVFALDMINKMGTNPDQWLINSLERFYAENFLGSPEMSEHLEDIIEVISNKSLNFETYADKEMIKDTETRITLMSANLLSSASETIKKFNPFGSTKFVCEQVLDYYYDVGKKLFQDQINETSILSSEDKCNFFIGIMKELNHAFIRSYETKCKEVFIKFKTEGFTEQQKTGWRETSGETTLRSIFESAEEHVTQMFSLAKLAFSRRRSAK